MYTLTLNRPKETFNQRCNYQVFADGEKVADLPNGSSQKIELPSQPKSLTAKLHWCGSKQLPIGTSADTSTVEVSGNQLFNQRLPYLICGLFFIIATISSWMDTTLAKGLSTGIICSFILVLIGMLSIWKDRWIHLRLG